MSNESDNQLKRQLTGGALSAMGLGAMGGMPPLPPLNLAVSGKTGDIATDLRSNFAKNLARTGHVFNYRSNGASGGQSAGGSVGGQDNTPMAGMAKGLGGGGLMGIAIPVLIGLIALKIIAKG